MNVLFLCNSPYDGGAEIWVRRVSVALRERGHGVVVAGPAGGPLSATMPAAGIPYVEVRAGPVLNKRSAASFALGWRRNRRRLIETIDTARRKFGIQVVHVGLTAEKLLVGSISPLPLVWTEHGPLPPLLIRSPLFGTYRRAARAAAVMHCVSKSTASHFAELGFAREQLRPVHFGLRWEQGSAARAKELRAELGLGADHVVVGSVSRLVWPKGLDALLAAASRLAERLDHVRVLLVGDGPLRQRLEAQTRRLGIEGRVVFAGRRSDVPDLLEMMDIHAAPSVTEGFPMAVLEAMHAGVPSVATAVGGHPEMIVDGETGFLTAPGDVEALADRLARLACDPAARNAMGAAARARARQAFGHASFLDRLEPLFSEAAASTPPSARSR
jgi:glycosyltransferase involved in cell wall biosynthesis